MGQVNVTRMEGEEGEGGDECDEITRVPFWKEIVCLLSPDCLKYPTGSETLTLTVGVQAARTRCTVAKNISKERAACLLCVATRSAPPRAANRVREARTTEDSSYVPPLASSGSVGMSGVGASLMVYAWPRVDFET